MRSGSGARGRAERASRPLALLAVVAMLFGVALLGAPPARASSYPTLTGHISGPTQIGMNLTAKFPVTATGGPAFGFNGTQVGTLSFSASVTGTNTTGVNVVPTAGVFVDGLTNLSLKANNVTQTLVITVEVTSGVNGSVHNVSTNLTYSVQVVQPYSLAATIVVASALGTMPFVVQVLLDGVLVGTVTVPSLTGHATYALSFSYVNTSLGPGWHTFTINLENEHGLVTFANGQTEYSQSFYIQAPSTNYTWVYVAAAAVFLGAILIFLTVVFGRRRGRRR